MDDFLGCALVVERELGGGIPYKAGSSFSVKSRVICVGGVVFFEWQFFLHLFRMSAYENENSASQLVFSF